MNAAIDRGESFVMPDSLAELVERCERSKDADVASACGVLASWDRRYDTDELIEQARGASIPEIFAEDGEPGFRRREKQVVEEVASSPRGVAR
mgnify:CR=1 FL=1